MSDLVKRALQILGTATIETGKSYTSNLTAFVNDAKDVRSMITQSTTNVSDTYNRLKNTNLTKKISDWFYQNELSSEQDAAEEFDSGMKTSDSGDESPSVSVDGEHRSRPLDTESMSDIFEKSTAAAFKIGRKQTEQSVINTSEIITTFNDRSSEIIASINNVNNTLIDIRKTLQDFTKAYSAVNSTVANNTEDKRSLYSNGQLSMGRIFELSKESFLNDNTIVGGARMIGQLLVDSSPEKIAQMGIEALLNRVKAPDLDKTIGEAAKSLNETIGTAIQTGLSEMIGTNLFKSIFGDISKIDGNFDYSSVANKTYTTQRAQFDGMTRQSIVTIIPEMLAKINESLSGRAFHVDNTGHWQEGPRQDKFVEVTHAAFAESGINYKTQQSISNNGMRSVGKQIPGEDVELAGKALTSMFVNYARAEGTSNLTIGMLKNMDTTEVVSDAANICASASKNGDLRYWVKVCQTVMLTVASNMGDGHRFVANVNQSLKNVSDRGMEFAKSGSVYSYQARAITKEMIAGEAVRMLSESGSAYDRKLKERNGILIEPVVDTKGKKKNKADTSTIDGRTEQAPKTRYTINEYVAAIYEILNRGINVVSVQAKNKKDLYKPIPIGQAAIYKNADDDFAQLFISNAMKGGSDAKTFKGIIREGMQEATDSLLGKESGGNGRVGNVLNAVLGGGSPIGNIISLLGAQSITSLSNSFMNGTLLSDAKARLNQTGESLKGVGGQIKDAAGRGIDKITGMAPGVIRRNKNVMNFIDEWTGEDGIAAYIADDVIDRIKTGFDNASEKVSSGVNSGRRAMFGGGGKTSYRIGRFLNDKAYKIDSKRLDIGNKLIDNYVPEDEMDEFHISAIRKSIEQGRFGAARDMAEKISDSSVRKTISNTINILEKRNTAEFRMAEGMEPLSIGAVSDQSFTDYTSGTQGAKAAKGNILVRGIKAIGKALGNIYSFLFKVFKSGLTDIFYGGRSMLRGYKTIITTAIKPFAFIGHQILTGIRIARTWIKETAVPFIKKNLVEPIKNGLSEFGNWIKAGASKTFGKVRDKFGKLLPNSILDSVGEGDGIISSFISGLTEPWREKKKSLEQDRKENPLLGKIEDYVSYIKDKMKKDEDVKNADSIINAVTEPPSEEDNGSTVSNTSVEEKLSIDEDRKNNPILGGIYDLLSSWIKPKIENDDDEPKQRGKKVKVRKVKRGNDEEPSMEELDPIALAKAREDAEKMPQNNRSTISEGDKMSSIEDVNKSTSTEENKSEDASNKDDGKTKGGIKGIVGSLSKALGQVLGGKFAIIFAVLKSILSATMGFTVVKELISDIKEIFSKSIEGLKPIFTELAGTIRTFMPAFKAVMDTIVESLKSILEPIVDIAEPLLKTLIPCVVDVVKLISDVLVPPIVWAVEKVSPLLLKFAQGISWVVEKISGGIYILAGGALKLISMLQSRLAQIVDGSSVVWETVKAAVRGDGNVTDIVEAGIEFASDQERYRSRAEIGDSYIKLGEDMLKGKEKDVTETVETKDFKDSVDTTHVALTNDFGAGDVTTINNYSYTYGSGNVTNNQNSYGNYMNMGERGCGPIALADAFNRRNFGANLNPRTLAESMLTSGAYIPSRGTSVASMITTGSGLGMNLHAGGVNRRSLGTASPTNPVTVYGSGTGFGTRPGNGHYVNVIGTDRMGNAYVNNPLTGRTSRQNINALISNSKLGLYGSGDADDFMFDEGTNAMMANLKELTNRLTGIFSFDNEADGSTEYEANRIKSYISEDDMKSIEENPEYQKALEGYQKAFKPKDGEDETSFLERIKKKFASTATAMKLIVKYGTPILNSIIEADKASLQAEAEQDKALSSALQSQLSGATAVSDIGAEMAPYSPINYTSTNIKNAASGASPVHDFFSATNGRSLKAISRNGGWFKKRNNPNSEGVGSQGEPSDGIIIHFNGMQDGKTALIKAITGGTVTYVGRNGASSINANGGLGNHVKWRDDAGMYHWYYHLGNIDSKISEGTKLEPGQLVGTVGTDIDKPTGYIEPGVHGFGYTLSKVGPYGSTGDGTENPLTYWKFEEAASGSQGPITLTDKMKQMAAWRNYKGLSAARDFITDALALGLTPGQVATIVSTGIWEDSGEKLWGSKSLRNKTYDYNGQVAAGIMNWVEADNNYGNTVPEQLKWIQNTYFNPNSTDYRATVRHTDYDKADLNSYVAATGRSGFKLSFGDKYGPIMDTDLIEGSEHYFRGALVPECIHTPEGVAKYVGTAAEAYNWMVEQGIVKPKTSLTEQELQGVFKSAMTNHLGTRGSGNLIEAASQVWEAAGKKLGAVYSNYDKGPITTRSGVTLQELHPDCSGMISGAMNYMGYTVKGTVNGSTNRWTTHDISGKTTNNLIYKDGQLSNDWAFIPYSADKVREGDILTTPDHVGLYIRGNQPDAYGFDAGNGERLPQLGNGAAKAYLDGDPNWRDQLKWTMGPGYGGLTTILRYLGGEKSTAEISGAGSNKGGITHYMSTITDAKQDRYVGDGPYPLLVEQQYPPTTETGPSSIWDIDTWSNMTAQQRGAIFTQLAKKHTSAVNKSASYSNEWAQGGTSADWEAMYNAYKTGTNQNIWDTESTLQQLAELRKVVGSGDVSSINGGYIPPLDMDSLMDSASYDGRTNQSINLFNIKPQSKSTDEMLDKINSMTFNVRAKRVEDLLEKLITIVSEGKEKPSVGVGTADPDPFLFNNSIPPQIARLVKG